METMASQRKGKLWTDWSLDAGSIVSNGLRYHLLGATGVRWSTDGLEILRQVNSTYIAEKGIHRKEHFFSPYQPEFCGWAFNLPIDSAEIAAVWSKIPDDTDVLITHGPPANILDKTSHGQRVGCPRLLSQVKRIKPRLHVFGHIHEAYGSVTEGSTIFVNASTCDLRYKPTQPPIAIDLPMKTRTWGSLIYWCVRWTNKRHENVSSRQYSRDDETRIENENKEYQSIAIDTTNNEKGKRE